MEQLPSNPAPYLFFPALPLQAGSALRVMNSINFEFLRPRRRELADLGGFAEHYAFADVTSALVKLRLFAESTVRAVFAEHKLLMGYSSNLNDLLNDPSFKSITPAVIQDKLHILRIKGNYAAHGTLHPLQPGKIIEFIQEAHDLGKWLHMSFDGGTLETVPAWKTITREAVDPTVGLRRETRAAQQKLAEQEALMSKLLADLEAARIIAEAAQKSEEETRLILKQAQQVATSLEFKEETTRFKLIDEQLATAGWKVGDRGKSTDEVGQEIEVLHQSTKTGKGFADYVLWDDDGKPLAVIEAKKSATDAEAGKMQAKYYADGLEKMHGQRPVIFYSNGYEIFIWDDSKGEPPRSLFGFYSKDSLQYCLFQRRNRERQLAGLNPKEAIVDRLYQVEAIKRVAENFDRRRRRALIIQATGTGKTRVAIALSELMVRAQWAKRILFLCDRKELRKQALNSFGEFLPSEPTVIVNANTSRDRAKRIYLATYPAMMKCFNGFDVGFFDLVIADESHRSIYNRYRDLFRYFDAFQVGLTATPVKFVFRNTYRLFECENGDPTFNYSYEEAVTHEPPYLCPFKVIKHTTKFLRDGIKYSQLSREQQEELEDQVEEPEDVEFSPEDLSRQVFNKDTDRQILKNLMENGVRNADGTRLGKSIIFARNHKHAKALVSLFNELYPQYGGDFCVRIDNYEPRADQLIDDFKSRDSSQNLTIAVSVDMLDTGIDVPSIVNLVFAKPVRSFSKFWQMIGRGTRLCPNLFGPGKDKKFFQIFDHWGNFEHFDQTVHEEEPSKSKSIHELLFEFRIKLAETALAAQDASTFQQATALLSADVAALPSDCLSIREQWRTIKGVQQGDNIAHFQPATVAVLKREIAPLMQWRVAHGGEASLKFDLLTTQLQGAMVAKSVTNADFRDALINEVSGLPINLAQVREKLPSVQQAKSTAFYETATVADIERLRIDLRGIMRFRKTTSLVQAGPVYLNIREEDSEVLSESHQPRLEGLDLAHYRARVEGVLRSLMEGSVALKKIKAGQPVLPSDLEELTSDVLIHDPDLHLEELLVHYPNKARRIDLAIRRIIGLDAEKVGELFSAFVQKYPSLNANQIRFLELLKSYISKYGAIELEKLWDAPFTSIHGKGVEGVFTNDAQVDDLLSLLKGINEVAA
jgi:type I restriction enzyme R subunit